MSVPAESTDARPPATPSGARTVLAGVFVNGALALVKGLTGFFGHSYALIADAIESTFDVFTSILVWFGLRYAARPPDEKHPYGHGKAEPLVACVVSLVLLGAAILIAVEKIGRASCRERV